MDILLFNSVKRLSTKNEESGENMQKIRLTDGTEYGVSEITESQRFSQVLQRCKNIVTFHIVGAEYGQLREKFEDELLTKDIKVVVDNGYEMPGYAGYTILCGLYINLESDRIEVTVMEGDTLEDEVKALRENVESFREGVESGSGIAMYPSIVALAKMQAQALPDVQALKVPELYPEWKQCIGMEVEADFKFSYEDVLYKTIQDKLLIQEQNVPGEGTESIYVRIDETHSGSMEDPIPYALNMVVFAEKYYTEDGKLYRCTRDSGIALQNRAADLVGVYFEMVE